jgi:hypothetical protein
VLHLWRTKVGIAEQILTDRKLTITIMQRINKEIKMINQAQCVPYNPESESLYNKYILELKDCLRQIGNLYIIYQTELKGVEGFDSKVSNWDMENMIEIVNKFKEDLKSLDKMRMEKLQANNDQR